MRMKVCCHLSHASTCANADGVLPFDEDSNFLTALLILLLIAVVLMVLSQSFGENPGDEKGCLMQGIHPWDWHVIGAFSSLTVLRKYRQKKLKEHTPLLPLSKNQKRRMKKRRNAGVLNAAE